MEHDFTEEKSNETYYRTVFCRKCGKVAWFHNWSPEKNIEQLQSRIGECLPLQDKE